MVTRASNIPAIESATGRTWEDIRAILDTAGGAELDHSALAEALYPHLEKEVENPGWWTQGAVVAYEQEIGRRLPGQRADGSFAVAVNATTQETPADTFSLVRSYFDGLLESGDGTLNGIEPTSTSRISETPKRRYWRVNLESGVKVEIAVSSKELGSESAPSQVAVQVEKLADPDAVESWRAWFKAALAEVLAG